MLLATYYAQNYAGIIDWLLVTVEEEQYNYIVCTWHSFHSSNHYVHLCTLYSKHRHIATLSYKSLVVTLTSFIYLYGHPAER